MKISNMTKAEMIEELRRHGYNASELDRRDDLRGRLSEARDSKRTHMRFWRGVFKQVARQTG